MFEPRARASRCGAGLAHVTWTTRAASRDLRHGDGPARRLPLQLRRAGQRVHAGPRVPVGQRLAYEHVDDVSVLAVDHGKEAGSRARSMARKRALSSTMMRPLYAISILMVVMPSAGSVRDLIQCAPADIGEGDVEA